MAHWEEYHLSESASPLRYREPRARDGYSSAYHQSVMRVPSGLGVLSVMAERYLNIELLRDQQMRGAITA